MRSFDIFDTLLARRSILPRAIFEAVEKASGRSGFAELRMRAEASIYQRESYTLADIYAAMVAASHMDEAEAQQLAALELQEEAGNLIAIRENIALVRPGDLLISDMYLPRSFIVGAVRDICGLRFNPVYLSSHGKSRGSAWASVARAFRVVEHLGDNEHSDVGMPSRYGITGKLTSAAMPTTEELAVRDMGYPELALAMRDARLGCWHADASKLAMARAEISHNFPLLFLTTLHLIRLALQKGWRRVLFSSRDCFLLSLLFQRLVQRLGLALDSEYFLTSRVARAMPSDAYLDYFRSVATDKAVVVDLCGTGWSLTRLLEAASPLSVDIFLMQHLENPRLMRTYQGIGATTTVPVVESITKEGNNVVLEALNTAEHPMIVDVAKLEGAFIPIMAETSGTERHRELVQTCIQSFGQVLAASDRIPAEVFRQWLSDSRPQCIEKLYSDMGCLSDAVKEVSSGMLQENQLVGAILARKAASASTAPPAQASELEGLLGQAKAGAEYFLSPSLDLWLESSPLAQARLAARCGRLVLQLAGGHSAALPTGKTGGFSLRVPDAFETAASGKQIRVSVVARAQEPAAEGKFAVAYSTNEVGNSGWRWFDVSLQWRLLSMEYLVPTMERGCGDFIGILPDEPGKAGIEIAAIAASIQHSS